jgi:hypothetical protein
VKVENREISSDFDELDNKSEELGLEWKKPLEKIKIKDFDSFKKFMTQA